MDEITLILATVKSASDTFGFTPYIMAGLIILLVASFISAIVKNKG